MARTLENYPNTDNTDPTNYPDGRVKDDPAGISGTPIDETTWGDWAMFFDKMMRMAGTASNNLPDNETNGYQLIHAMLQYINAFVAPLIINLIGSGYSASAVYVLTGCETAADNGIVFYNGGVYFLGGFSGPACGGFTVQVLTISALNADSFLPHIGVTCGTSGSGLGNWTTLVRTFGVTFDAWTNVGTFTSNFASAGSTVAPRYTRNGQQGVYLMGKITNTTGAPVSGGVMFTLPAGYRPSHEFSINSSSTNGYVVRTNGDVELTGTLSNAPGTTLDLGSISFLTI